MPNPIIALTKCNSYEPNKVRTALMRQFELLGGTRKFVKFGDNVLLKPNFVMPRPADSAVQTHPTVIIETAKLLKDFGCKPFVADSPGWGTTLDCIKILGLEQPLKKLGVPFMQLNQPIKKIIDRKKVNISSIATNADVIINLSKLKSHQQIVATFAIKNMFGCVSGKQKAYWHYAKGKSHQQFAKFLIEIYKYLNPALTIIDAIIAMEGRGPTSGQARNLGVLIGGVEPVSCERVCCKLINFEPGTVPIIQAAEKMNFGCNDFEQIKIVGDELADVICSDFRRAEPAPIRFSLPRVCKSILKQALLVAKNAITKNK